MSASDAHSIELQLPCDVRFVGLARLIVTTAARHAGLSEERVEDLKIAVSEATANAINAHRRGDRHAPVVLSVRREADAFEVAVADAGPGFDPPAGTPDGASGPEWPAENGLGLVLIRDLADDVDFTRGDGMTVRMRFTVGDEPQDVADEDL